MADFSCFSCIICWQKFNGDCNVSKTNCGHIYHSECIQNWIERESLCPVCGSEHPTPSTVFPSFLENSDSHSDASEVNQLDLGIQASMETRISELEKDFDHLHSQLINYVCRESEKIENTN